MVAQYQASTLDIFEPPLPVVFSMLLIAVTSLLHWAPAPSRTFFPIIGVFREADWMKRRAGSRGIATAKVVLAVEVEQVEQHGLQRPVGIWSLSISTCSLVTRVELPPPFMSPHWF